MDQLWYFGKHSESPRREVCVNLECCFEAPDNQIFKAFFLLYSSIDLDPWKEQFFVTIFFYNSLYRQKGLKFWEIGYFEQNVHV